VTDIVAKMGGGVYAGLAVVNDPTSTTGYKAVIVKGSSTANTITIKNFDLAKAKGDDGYLDIKIDPTYKAAVTANASPDPFTTVGYTPGSGTAGNSTLFEGTGKTFSVYLNQAAKLGDSLVLSFNNLGNKFKAILGDTTVDADGTQINLTDGQTEVRFALVQQGELQSDASATFSVHLQTADGEGDTVTNAWTLNLKQGALVVHNILHGTASKDRLSGGDGLQTPRERCRPRRRQMRQAHPARLAGQKGLGRRMDAVLVCINRSAACQRTTKEKQCLQARTSY